MQTHRSSDAASTGALAGLKVIDLSRVLGGPYCTMILADHGADVIKVEPPQGDETRQWGPPFATRPDGSRDASYFLGVNRNKRSIALDISLPQGREVLLRLLEGADVLVENFKTGTMEKWGLGYSQTLAARFPRLVHCRVSGFGADGPLGGLPGYDAIVQAMSGLMSINGEVGGSGLRLATPIVDLATGLYSAIAVLMALQERARSGRGQFIDMTLYDCATALLHPQAANYLLNGARPAPLGNAHPNVAPYDKWTTRTGELFIAVGNDRQFRDLVQILGEPQLATDPRFCSNADRMAHRSALREALTGAFAQSDGDQLAQRLLRAGVPAGVVVPIDAALASEQARVRAMVVQTGDVQSVGTPIKFSRARAQMRCPPPVFAADGEALLRDIGFSKKQIEELARAGVLLRGPLVRPS
ncbi:MAG TPA: CaiB/BaiF CoA-transferase family protein [Burkholderiaceae bacterium]|nr:CaiB/BaiF CoA-transferase family protein [Burkholderiaceae bacterium]